MICVRGKKPAIFRPFFTAIALQAGLFAPLLAPAATAEEVLLSRDLGNAELSCTPTSFIVSLNIDDDDGDKKPDLHSAAIGAGENNLRLVTFNIPNAIAVTLGDPRLVKNNANALQTKARPQKIDKDKRVRAYALDRRTPFVFNKSYPVPVSFYLEGVKQSEKLNDFKFAFTAIGEKGQEICKVDATGTVIEAKGTFKVGAGSGGKFKTHNKMLTRARGWANHSFKPKGLAPVWQYPGAVDATSLPRNQRAKARRKAQERAGPAAPFAHIPTELENPRKKKTKFIAGTQFTPIARLNREELIARIKDKDQIIEVHTFVNITAPTGAEAYNGWTDGRPRVAPRNAWYSVVPKTGALNLFASGVDYRILDQFDAHIEDSAWADEKIKVRENIREVLTSELAPVRNWINRKLNHTGRWTNKDNGEINDNLEAKGLPKIRIMTRNTKAFDARLRRVGGVIMHLGTNSHEWYTSVGGIRPFFTVTENDFSVRVREICDSNIQPSTCVPAIGITRSGIRIRVESNYTVDTN